MVQGLGPPACRFVPRYVVVAPGCRTGYRPRVRSDNPDRPPYNGGGPDPHDGAASCRPRFPHSPITSTWSRETLDLVARARGRDRRREAAPRRWRIAELEEGMARARELWGHLAERPCKWDAPRAGTATCWMRDACTRPATITQARHHASAWARVNVLCRTPTPGRRGWLTDGLSNHLSSHRKPEALTSAAEPGGVGRTTRRPPEYISMVRQLDVRQAVELLAEPHLPEGVDAAALQALAAEGAGEVVVRLQHRHADAAQRRGLAAERHRRLSADGARRAVRPPSAHRTGNHRDVLRRTPGRPDRRRRARLHWSRLLASGGRRDGWERPSGEHSRVPAGGRCPA